MVGSGGKNHRVLLPFRSSPCLGLALLWQRGKKARTFQDSIEHLLRPTWFSASQSLNPASPTTKSSGVWQEASAFSLESEDEVIDVSFQKQNAEIWNPVAKLLSPIKR